MFTVKVNVKVGSRSEYRLEHELRRERGGAAGPETTRTRDAPQVRAPPAAWQLEAWPSESRPEPDLGELVTRTPAPTSRRLRSGRVAFCPASCCGHFLHLLMEKTVQEGIGKRRAGLHRGAGSEEAVRVRIRLPRRTRPAPSPPRLIQRETPSENHVLSSPYLFPSFLICLLFFGRIIKNLGALLRKTVKL